MKSAVRLLAVFAIAILAGVASQAQAAPDCGENTGKKATGKSIPIGAVTTMSGVGSFKEADDAVRAYFDCVNAKPARRRSRRSTPARSGPRMPWRCARRPGGTSRQGLRRCVRRASR